MSLNEHTIGLIIPAYNEEERIGATVRSLVGLSWVDRILVIDDGSTDQTAAAASASGAEVISLPKNRGKAFAMKTGFEAMHTDIVVFLDGDITEGAEQARRLVTPICDGTAEVVIARLKMTSGKGGFGFVRKLAEKGLFFLTGHKLTSVLSGQRAFLSNILTADHFDYKGFGIEFGMTVDLIRRNRRIKEVDVEMKHQATGRDLRGFIHRFRQFVDILCVFLAKAMDRVHIKGNACIPKEQDKV